MDPEESEPGCTCEIECRCSFSEDDPVEEAPTLPVPFRYFKMDPYSLGKAAAISSIAVYSIVFLDSHQHGSFEKSATKKFLRDTGLHKVGKLAKLPTIINQIIQFILDMGINSLISTSNFFYPYVKFLLFDMYTIFKNALKDISKFMIKNPTVVSIALIAITMFLLYHVLVHIFPAIGSLIIESFTKAPEEPEGKKGKKKKRRKKRRE